MSGVFGFAGTYSTSRRRRLRRFQAKILVLLYFIAISREYWAFTKDNRIVLPCSVARGVWARVCPYPFVTGYCLGSVRRGSVVLAISLPGADMQYLRTY